MIYKIICQLSWLSILLDPDCPTRTELSLTKSYCWNQLLRMEQDSLAGIRFLGLIHIYVGFILSAQKESGMRSQLLNIGISHVNYGSRYLMTPLRVYLMKSFYVKITFGIAHTIGKACTHVRFGPRGAHQHFQLSTEIVLVFCLLLHLASAK